MRSPLPLSKRWSFKVLAATLPILLLALVDLGLRATGLTPPEDPMLLYARSQGESFNPFQLDRGDLVIRSDWAYDREDLRVWSQPGEDHLFLLPAFRSVRLSRIKPPGTLRIVVLGGSTTFGLFVGRESAFPAVLGRRLQEHYPGHQFEILNLGCPGWPAHRVVGLFDAVLGLDPDLVVIYSGHNESLVGPGRESELAQHRGQPQGKLQSASVLYRWIHHGIHGLGSRRSQSMAEGDLATLVANSSLVSTTWHQTGSTRSALPPEDYLQGVAARYEESLNTMVTKARGAGVPTLFVLPVANPFAPPGGSAHGTAGIDRGRFERLFEQARAEFTRGRFPQALEDLDTLVAMSPRYAAVHFWRGITLMYLHRWAEAQEALQAARDFDLRSHRMTSILEATLLNTMKRSNTAWVELGPHLRPRDISTSRQLFVDHCHPTVLGHRMLAEDILPAAVRLLGLTKSPRSQAH